MLVVVVIVFGWWIGSGNGFSGPPGNDARYAVPDADATGPASSSEPVPTSENGVRIDGFVKESDTLLALRYTTGVPECYGTLDTPRVLETDGAVTVTLMVVPPERRPDRCPDIAKVGTVRIDLDAALGDRSLLDGSLAQPARVRETERSGN
jgi:hypothetical protein